jgi:microcystin degradation protein MlrC
MRIGIVGLRHESNTFLSTPTDLPLWERLAGDDVRERWAGTHNEMGGFLAGLEAEGATAVPVYSALATPAGMITSGALDALTGELFSELEMWGPYDGILAAAHGAAVSVLHADADAHWLGRLREAVGSDTPIVCTVDAHANLSQEMLDATDALISYRSNPHLDTHDRGLEAARLVVGAVRGEVRPTQVGVFPPVAINILQQGTTVEPCLPLYQLAEGLRGEEGVLSVSICLGFPYADVPEMGTSFNVVTDGDPGLAARAVGRLAAHLVARRDQFVPELVSPEEAVEKATDSPGPVCLLDMGDNVGGGSAGDGTTLASVVYHRGGPKTFIALFDPEGVAAAWEAGAGSSIELEVGGKTDDLHGPPLPVRATVRGLHDGRWEESEVRHGGNPRFDMGDTAILETDGGLTVQLTSKRVAPFSLGQITSCGLDPAEFQILVAKGVHAPVPAYEPVCPTIIRVNTPGSTSADMLSLHFRHRRRPLFPFEDIV